MTLLLSAVDVAIARASERGTLRVAESVNRFGDPYYAVEDDHGVIAVCLTRAEVDAVLSGRSRTAEKLTA